MALTAQARRRLFADMTLVLVAFIWGLGIPISSNLVKAISPIWASALRMSVAGIAVLLVYPMRIRRATPSDWKGGLILGSFVSCIFALMGFALFYSTASKQAFIIGTSVLMVPFLAWAVNKRRPNRLVFIGAALGTTGLLVMGFSPGMRFNFGDALNLAMCFFWAGQVIVIEYLVKRMDPTTLVALQLPICGAILTVAALIVEGPVDLFSLTAVTWGEILFTGIFNTVICFILQTRALKNTTASHAAIILSLESVFGYILSIILGHDPFFIQGALGGVIIMCGVFTAEMDTIMAANTPITPVDGKSAASGGSS